ncbi:CLUMA_CG014482, isoform A [Clunio marinus]|uniref:Tetraspanin n=1 Tax=Clunio marinus TaxID=568069 RepID=A0A1J1ILC1_9DIPT|nr:CLUMA_CG014482, isoform A [Clunio marinus]
MALSSSGNCMKYFLFLLNFVFVITGIVILSVGLTVQGIFDGYSDFLDSQFFTLPIFLIVIGSIIFVIAFFGCFGAMKENYCMIITFCGLLSIIFILELSAGITGYILKNSTYSLITSALKPTMADYTSNSRIANGWDNIQETYQCCGLETSANRSGYEDWIDAVQGIPLSCCDIPNGHLDFFYCNATAETLHPQGCVQSFGDFIKFHALQLALVGVILAIIQLFGLLFACLIARQIKKRRNF